MKKIFSFLILAATLVLLFSLTVAADGISNGETSVISLSIKSYPDKIVYGAFERFDTSGLELLAKFSDGSEKILSGSDVRVSYLKDNCLRSGDNSVILSYGEKSLYLPVTVNRIEYDIASLNIDSFSTIYNGSFQSLKKSFLPIVGLDGIPLNIKIHGGGTNVGNYDISIDFSTASVDYIPPESRTINMEIKPAKAEVIWESLSFVYDGKSKLPTAYYIDISGAKVYTYVKGAATNAGTGYSATVVSNDPNYEFTNTSATYEIRKADYDFSSVKWSEDSFTYDGSKKSVTVSGLPLGVSVVGYLGDIGQNAGIYTTTAILKWDENNYNTPKTLSHKWEIKKANYNMSSVNFKSTSAIYDGKMHYPTFVGEMPTGLDGIRLEYSFSDGACHVSEGTVSVTISFHTDSINYNIPLDRYSSVTVSPLGIKVNWGELNISYSGENVTPVAYSEHCKIDVSGSAVNVGKYYATASTQNTDYYIINDRVEYNVIKAHNYWTEKPSDSICYEGKNINLNGESLFGEITIEYFSDAEGINKITAPTLKGKYYARLSVVETDNYSSLSSEIISFEIIEVIAESFVAVVLNKNLKAFDTIDSDDAVFSVINNDGSVDLIDVAKIGILYQNGTSLRKCDNEIIFTYGKFNVKIPIEVGYADYDLSSVKWENLSAIYDGDIKNPTLIGLPDGVRLIGYAGGDNISAGKYEIKAIVDYDMENYNEPKISHCTFVIEKCPIKPTLISSAYNGEKQIPISNSPLYTVTRCDEYTDCGIYTVVLALADTDNYIFEDTGSFEAYGLFEIKPAVLNITISDIKLRLFEKAKSADYRITSGNLYQGDDLMMSVYTDGGKVFLKSANPNYTVNVIPGQIIRLPYPTPEGGIILIISFIFLSSAVVLLVLTYRNRQKIMNKLAVIRCKWHNRNFKASPPKEEQNSFFLPPLLPSKTEAEIIQGEEVSTVEASFEVDAEKADSLITDSLAKGLIRREGEVIYTNGSEKTVINLDTLSKSFESGERIDVNILKSKRLISDDVAFIKILGGGKLDKALMIYANEFSLSAVKMIALTGGQAIKIHTVREKSNEEKD